MRRPALRRQQPGVALFPFLAVLICTMGSLIVLLVLVVQQARKSAAAERAVREAQVANQITNLEQAKRKAREEAEDIQWRAEVLQTQRESYAEDLAKKRLELAHLEDHLRRLEDQARRLQAMAKSQTVEPSLDEKLAEERLAELRKKIVLLTEEAEKLKREAAARKPAYAILPYDGPNGTSRRPIYIECREEGIILQPEGIVFNAVDFQGPLGPGNPLDASLRTVREHFARDGRGGEPYPLVIVRPNGATAFGACRAAMKHWENEFGYELVAQEMQLAYPAADPRLAEALQRTIRDARSRQAALAAAMPSRFGGEGKLTSFRSEPPPEAIVAEGGSGSYGSGGSSRTGTNGGLPGGMTGGTRSGTGGSGIGPTSLSGSGSNLGPGGSGGQGTLGGAGSGRTGGNSFAGNPGGGTSTAGSSGITGSTSGAQGQPSTTGGTGNNATGSTAGSPGGNAFARNTGGSSANIASPYGSSVNGGGTAQSGTPTNGLRSGSQSSGSNTSGSTSGGNAGAAGSGSSQSGQPSLNVSPQNANTNAKAKRALAQRGENWGLPVTSDKAVGIRRPIRVECAVDRLTIIPERGDAHAPLVIPMERGVENHLEPLLESVWSQMDRWGIAVLGGFWKPVLSVDVVAGGEARYEELRTALQGSGIEVERRRR